MKSWLLAVLIAASLIKVFTTGDGKTALQIGVPWLWPFDSPAAACIRAPDEAIIECGVGSMMTHKAVAVTVADLGTCRWCIDTSVALASFGRDEIKTQRRMRELRALAE